MRNNEQEPHHEILSAIERLHQRLSDMEERLKRHYEEEHKEFGEVVTWFRGLKVAKTLLGWAVVVTAGAAGAWSWLKDNFSIAIK